MTVFAAAAAEDSEDEEDEDERKLLAKDYIGEKYDWQLTEFQGPEIQKDEVKTPFFTPSSEHVDIVQKLEEGQQPRFPEEEGMYIGFRPRVSQRNQNRLERR